MPCVCCQHDVSQSTSNSSGQAEFIRKIFGFGFKRTPPKMLCLAIYATSELWPQSVGEKHPLELAPARWQRRLLGALAAREFLHI